MEGAGWPSSLTMPQARRARPNRNSVVSGHPLLMQAALDAVQQWRYKPVIHGGVAVEVERSAKVVFALR